MKKRVISCLLLFAMVSAVMCACTKEKETNYDTKVITDEVSKIPETETEALSETASSQETTYADDTVPDDEAYYKGSMRIVDVLDDNTVTCQLVKALSIPKKDYALGEQITCADGRNYTVCSFDEALPESSDDEEILYARDIFLDSNVSHDIALSREDTDYEGKPFLSYFVLEPDDSNNTYILEDSFGTYDFGMPTCYQAEILTVKVTPQTQFKYLDTSEEYADNNMLNTISADDFMHGSFPETAMYHLSESKYYIDSDESERCYSDGFGEIKDGVLLQFEEVYTP